MDEKLSVKYKYDYRPKSPSKRNKSSLASKNKAELFSENDLEKFLKKNSQIKTPEDIISNRSRSHQAHISSSTTKLPSKFAKVEEDSIEVIKEVERPSKVYLKSSIKDEEIKANNYQIFNKIQLKLYSEDMNFFEIKQADEIKSLIEDYSLIKVHDAESIKYVSKTFKVLKKCKEDSYSKNDIIFFKGHRIKITNSIINFLNNYQGNRDYILYKKVVSFHNKKVSIKDQNNQCFFCNNVLLTSNLFNKIFFCNFFNRYICHQCISDELINIPNKILKYWDFGKYLVSIKGSKIIKMLWHKPIITIKKDDSLVKKSLDLTNSIFLKSKINKIYDLMKCDEYAMVADNILGDYKYLVLKENLFSLNDLYEIYEGEDFIPRLMKYIGLLEDHIVNKCEACKYTPDTCYICRSDELLYEYNIESVTKCKNCNKVSHKKCCSVHVC